jgi:transposase
VGRPTKLTDELRDEIVALVEVGNFPETAAEACGVDRSTFYRWKNRGDDGEEPYRDFCDAIARARAKAKVDLLATVQTHASLPKGGAHAQWLLEKLDRDRFGPQVRVMVANELERYIDVAERVLKRDEFARLLEAWSDVDAGEEAVGRSSGSVAEH